MYSHRESSDTDGGREALWMGPDAFDWDFLVKDGYQRRFAAGSVIYREEDHGECIHYLLEGLVKISMAAPDGTDKILAIHQPGTLFGESAVLDHGCYFATATVIEDALVCLIPSDKLVNLIRQHPEVSFQMMSNLVQRIRLLAMQVGFLTFLSVPQRLARMICGLAESFGTPVDDGVLITVRLRHRELAELVSASRVTVTNTLNEFKRLGLIRIHDGRILVMDPDELMRL